LTGYDEHACWASSVSVQGCPAERKIPLKSPIKAAVRGSDSVGCGRQHQGLVQMGDRTLVPILQVQQTFLRGFAYLANRLYTRDVKCIPDPGEADVLDVSLGRPVQACVHAIAHAGYAVNLFGTARHQSQISFCRPLICTERLENGLCLAGIAASILATAFAPSQASSSPPKR
jgi:hypothetical protein